jgi:hypothetical protein
MFVLYIYERRVKLPTKTIYVPDEALQVFDKAKELAGESISAIVIQALNDFILKKELEENCMEPFERWEGTEDYNFNIISGNWIKFYGKKLSEALQDKPDPEIVCFYELFYTRKGQFLLYSIKENQREGKRISGYIPYKSLKEIMDRNHVPPKLIFDAEKQMPGVMCEEIDV